MRGKFGPIDHGGRGARRASMRPAHCAREVDDNLPEMLQAILRFNEARALCAGS